MSSHSTSALHSSPTRRSSDLHYLEVMPFGKMLGADGSDVFERHLRIGGRTGDVKSQNQSVRGAIGHTIVLPVTRSEEHTSELQSPCNLVCRLLLEKKKYLLSC